MFSGYHSAPGRPCAPEAAGVEVVGCRRQSPRGRHSWREPVSRPGPGSRLQQSVPWLSAGCGHLPVLMSLVVTAPNALVISAFTGAGGAGRLCPFIAVEFYFGTIGLWRLLIPGPRSPLFLDNRGSMRRPERGRFVAEQPYVKRGARWPQHTSPLRFWVSARWDMEWRPAPCVPESRPSCGTVTWVQPGISPNLALRWPKHLLMPHDEPRLSARW